MVSRRPISKYFSLIFEKFCESPILKNFAGINFRESTLSGVKKGIYFPEFGQNSRNPRNYLPAKISSLKVCKFNLRFEVNLDSYYNLD